MLRDFFSAAVTSPNILHHARTGTLAATSLIAGPSSQSQLSLSERGGSEREVPPLLRVADDEVFEALPQFDWAAFPRVHPPLYRSHANGFR